MIAALLAGVLTVLIGAAAGRRLMPPSRPVRGAESRLRRLPRSTARHASLLDAVARQVRSGSSLTSAVIDEVGASPPFDDVAMRLAAGGSLGDALATLNTDDPDVALAVQALAATAHLGGPIAATLDEAATVLRERAAARDERSAQGAQARLSARVLTVVPLGFALWSAIASQRTRDAYVSSIAAIPCTAGGLLLNLAGWRWMKKIIGPT